MITSPNLTLKNKLLTNRLHLNQDSQLQLTMQIYKNFLKNKNKNTKKLNLNQNFFLDVPNILS